MRTLPGVVIVALVLLAAGCGGSNKPERTAYQQSLAKLCDETRVQLEQIGQVRDVGLAKWEPATTKVGRNFVKQLKALDTPSYVKQQAKQLAQYFDLYYEGQRYAYDFLKAGNSDAFAAAQEDALRYLRAAEALSTRMGAPECSRRPFEPPVKG